MIVWAASIDRNKTRHQGRRIPKSLSIDSPRLSEIEAAAKASSLSVIAKPGGARPTSWWDKSGYLIVEKGKIGRSELLKTIAKQVTKERLSKKT